MNRKELVRELRSYKFPEKIIKAFEKVQRENFVSEDLKDYAYLNQPLPIGEGQTISQPYTIAFMLTLLELEDSKKILEVGSGSGYVLALMNEISKNSKIYGIEIKKELVEKSRKVLANEENILVVNSEGSDGLKEQAQFDRIIVSAAAKEIPVKLLRQLKSRGVMVVPVRNSILQIKKFTNENKIKEFPGFSFVPLVKGEN